MDFKVGDKVKILTGEHEGETGVIRDFLSIGNYPIQVEVPVHDTTLRSYREGEIEKA